VHAGNGFSSGNETFLRLPRPDILIELPFGRVNPPHLDKDSTAISEVLSVKIAPTPPLLNSAISHPARI
jgi:hypothetical protein